MNDPVKAQKKALCDAIRQYVNKTNASELSVVDIQTALFYHDHVSFEKVLAACTDLTQGDHPLLSKQYVYYHENPDKTAMKLTAQRISVEEYNDVIATGLFVDDHGHELVAGEFLNRVFPHFLVNRD